MVKFVVWGNWQWKLKKSYSVIQLNDSRKKKFESVCQRQKGRTTSRQDRNAVEEDSYWDSTTCTRKDKPKTHTKADVWLIKRLLLTIN